MKLKFFFVQSILLTNQKYDIDSFWKNRDKFGFYDTHGNIKQLFPIEKDIVKNVPNIMNYQNFDKNNILHYKDNTIIFQGDFSKQNIKLFQKWQDSTIYETISNDIYYRFGVNDYVDGYTFSSQDRFKIKNNNHNCQKIICKDNLIFSMNHDNIFTICNFSNNNSLFEIPFLMNTIVEKMEINKYDIFIHCCIKFLDRNEIVFLVFQHSKNSEEVFLKQSQKISINENVIDFDFDEENLIIVSKFLAYQYKIHLINGISKEQIRKKYFKKPLYFSKICLFDNVIFFNGDKNLQYLKVE